MKQTIREAVIIGCVAGSVAFAAKYKYDRPCDYYQYDRTEWKHWSDLDGDGRDTREELLQDEGCFGPVIYTAEECGEGETTGCVGEAQLCVGPYSGNILFKDSVHVDHLVSLKEAHETGGAVWSEREKEVFANDKENLLVVDATENQSKGSRGEAEWLPKVEKFRPQYFDKRNYIREKYGLWVKPEDVIAMLSETRRLCRSSAN